MFYSTIKMNTLTSIGRDEQKKINQILNNLIDLPESTEFLNPVPWREMELDDYPDIIKYPMNLYKVQQKLKNRDYNNVQQALDQIQLIWDNCKQYNKEGLYFDLAQRMQKAFKKMIKNYLPNIQFYNQQKPIINTPPQQMVKKPLQNYQQNLRQNSNKQSFRPAYQKNLTPQQQISDNQKQEMEPQIQQIPMSEKNRFNQRLKLITQQQLAQIVLLIQQSCLQGFKHISGGRYQIVMDNIDTQTFKKLNQKVDEYIENEKLNGVGSKKIKV